jgi:signal transduction histidine kinase
LRDDAWYLANEQAAFRRVATLVAHEPPPADVFATLAAEVGGLLRADMTHVHRSDAVRSWTVVGSWSADGPHLPLGRKWTDDGGVLEHTIVNSARTARIDDYEHASISIAADLRQLGVTSSVAAPIIVDGGVWGMLAACTSNRVLPDTTETRLTDFAELVGTAVANAESRRVLSELADAQAALRRVATLVAHEPRRGEVFSAVAEEARWLIGADVTALLALHAEDGATVMAGSGAPAGEFPAGAAVPTGSGTVAGHVGRTGRAARLDDFEPGSGVLAAYLRELGVHSVVGAPVLVEGRLWGVLIAGDRRPLPARTEERLGDFAELVAVAISNAQSRAELAESRARIVSASDEARRRIERNLHDGIQQRLVSLGLELRAAQAAIPDQPDVAQRTIDAVADGLTTALDDLREISRGIHPAILAGGLTPALRALARRSPVPVEMQLEPLGEVAEPMQVAVYYVVSEAFANAAKHGHASLVRLRAERAHGVLRVSVADDGIGGADPARGSGLIGLSDRIGAIGGRLAIDSPAGGGTSIVAELPAGSRPDRRGAAGPPPRAGGGGARAGGGGVEAARGD